MSGIMLNWDDTAFANICSAGNSKEEIESNARAIIDQYAGTQVTDVLLCVLGRCASRPSKVWEGYYQKYLQKTENGITVDYSRLKPLYDMYITYGADPYETAIERCLEIGITPWLSFRMNDAHETYEKTSFLAPDYYYEHPEFRRVRHHPPDDYFSKIYDYGFEAVRKRFLDEIEDAFSRYDAYGCELDWQREIFCFSYGGEYAGIGIINEFIGSVRKLLDGFEKKRGHRILLGERIPAGLEAAYYSGFDALTWAREGLVDVLVPTPRWGTCEPDMPLELWKTALAGTKTALAPGIEICMRESPSYPLKFSTLETVNGCAAGYHCAGADKIYLFNFMFNPNGADFSEERNPVPGRPREDEKNCLDRLYHRELLKTIGDRQTSLSAPRRHLVSFRDAQPFWEKPFVQVPRRCENGYERFRIRTGLVPADGKVTLILGVESDNGVTASCAEEIVRSADVWVNSRPLRYSHKEPLLCEYTETPRYVWNADLDTLDQVNTVEIKANLGAFTVKHIELRVERT